MGQRSVVLAGDADWPGFRSHARALLAQQIPPEAVTWHTRAAAAEDLFADTDAATGADLPGTQATPPSAETPSVPPWFMALCESAVLHRDPARFGLLYRLLWRLVHEPALREDTLDADRMRAELMARAVRRDLHKMTAFVRFRVLAGEEGAAALHVAWFEPEHHIVEAVAPFFMRRFTQMRWAIFTPERSVRWDGETLELGPGGRRDEAPPADAGEALWLIYYRHIFNPARLKLAMMCKEMPRKYWHNLPEAVLIGPLSAQALPRTGRMIEAPATMPRRRIAAGAQQPPKETDVSESHPLQLPEDPKKALALLRAATDRCRACPLGEHATQSVFGEGPVGATLMLVGEQPGDQEDLQGRPFVGPAGRLLDRAIVQLGWERERLYVTNAVKHFKYELRGKRRIHKTPAQREAAACLHWLESEIDQVKPQALIALGATAARSLLGRPAAVMRERGQWHEGLHGLQVLVTLHPSALLRGDPAEHEAAFAQWLQDLSMASELFGKSARRHR